MESVNADPAELVQVTFPLSVVVLEYPIKEIGNPSVPAVSIMPFSSLISVTLLVRQTYFKRYWAGANLILKCLVSIASFAGGIIYREPSGFTNLPRFSHGLTIFSCCISLGHIIIGPALPLISSIRLAVIRPIR